MKPIHAALALISLAATACGAELPPEENKAAGNGPTASVEPAPKGDAKAPVKEATWSLKANALTDLPACTKETTGRMAWVISDKAAFACDGEAWAALELRGKDGKDGKDGVSVRGEKGEKGDPGTNGVNGRDGVDGLAGANGANGTNGVNGTNGTSGTTAATLTLSRSMRLFMPISYINSVTATSYSTSVWASNVVVEFEGQTFSDGSRCAEGVAILQQNVAPYSPLRAVSKRVCSTGDLRVGFSWTSTNGHSLVWKTDGTFSAQAGAWTQDQANPVWTAVFVPSTNEFSVPNQ